MAKTKRKAKKKAKSPARRKKPAAKRAASPKKPARRRKPPARKRRAAPRSSRPTVKPKAAKPSPRRTRGRADATDERPEFERGLGPESGGQSGDTEGLSRAELADSESVEELVEEGQAFEAGIIEGIEDAPDADEGEIKTREVPEDDVPEEYLDED